jgi:hypothetical protein
VYCIRGVSGPAPQFQRHRSTPGDPPCGQRAPGHLHIHGHHLGDRALHPEPPANSPALIAQSPTATTIRGSLTALNVRRNGTAIFRVTGPVTSRASACRGEATSRPP